MFEHYTIVNVLSLVVATVLLLITTLLFIRQQLKLRKMRQKTEELANR